MFFKTSDDVKIAYTLKGEFGRPVVVFLNGYSASQSTWLAQIQAFLDAGYRTLTWDYRAHGQSDRVGYGLRVARLAQDLHEMLIALHLDNIVLVGHSMGVSVAYEFESLAPEVGVMAIVSEDQPPKMIGDSQWHFGRQGLSYEDVLGVAQHFPHMRLMNKPVSDELKRQIGSQVVLFDYAKTQPLLVDGLVQNFLDVVRREQVPHLFLAGGASLLYDSQHAEAARKLQGHPSSAAFVFEDVGHIPHLEMPALFNQVVLSFLKTSLEAGNEL